MGYERDGEIGRVGPEEIEECLVWGVLENHVPKSWF